MSRDIYPKNSKGAVNRAGERLVKGSMTPADIQIIENWRAAHNYVLNTFQASLRRRAKDSGARTPVQRIKRLETIQNKLKRFEKMKLARMHDIVGCRIVFDDLEQLQSYRKNFNRSRFRHKRRVKTDDDGNAVDAYDYISFPKFSGYRGIHDVFEYRAKQSGASKSAGGEKWNGLHIEIQYRTRVQHAWATAVEICDKYTENHGKFSDAEEQYLRYFVIASELLARHFEPETPRQLKLTDKELTEEFDALEAHYGMLKTLQGIQPSQEKFDTSRNTLLIFNEENETVEVRTFFEFRKAIEAYFEIERTKSADTDVVLVAADDPDSVRFGFKNYFSDAREFVTLVSEAMAALGTEK
jgi:ppGpp synthetase/RelA/SpoT-type nucleotidyltranferase